MKDNSKRRDELHTLRSEIQRKVDYIRDDNRELWLQAQRWIKKSYNQPVGSVRTHVKRGFSELGDNPDHKRTPHGGVTDAEDAFPEECEGCVHYGGTCPFVMQPKKGKLERIYDTSDGDREFIERMFDLASETHCDVLSVLLNEWDSDYRSFMEIGHEIRTRVVAEVAGHDVSSFDFDADVDLSGLGPAPTPSDFPNADNEPPAEALARIDEVVSALNSEEDEDGNPAAKAVGGD